MDKNTLQIKLYIKFMKNVLKNNLYAYHNITYLIFIIIL